MAESAGERTEDATPKRRQEARRKGTVAKSMDLTGSLVVVVAIASLPAIVSSMGNGMLHSLGFAFTQVPSDLSMASLERYTLSVAQPVAIPLAIFIAMLMVAGLAANFGQVGFVMSGEALNPTFAKINPANGIKRLFSTHSAVEGIKACAKSLIFGWIAYSAIVGSWDRLIGLSALTPKAALVVLGNLLVEVAWKVVAAWFVLAAFDYFYQRKNTEKQLRMTKQEVKQEMKEAETSPELRSAMAQRRRKLSKGRMMQSVATADVVITNPTHFAVALKYDDQVNPAPQVVAKGQDYLAAKIRETAEAAGVPLVPNPPLARSLYKKCEVGDFVPKDLFQPVAEVLAYVYSTIRKVRQRV